MNVLDGAILKIGDAMARLTDFRIQYLCDEDFRAMADMWLYSKDKRAKNWTGRRIFKYLRENEISS